MKKLLLLGLCVVLLMSIFNLGISKNNGEKAQIKRLLLQYEQGKELSNAELDLIDSYITEPGTPFIMDDPPIVYSPEAYVINEGFETSVPPTGWLQYAVTGTNSWEQSTERVHSGTYAAKFNDWNVDNDVWLITSAADLSGMTTPDLKYWENVNYGSYADSHNVKISTDYTGSGDPNNASWTLLRDVIGTEDTWVEITIDLTAYAGQTVYVAWQYTGNFASEWWIDDVLIGEADPYVVDVTKITPDAVIVEGSSYNYFIEIENEGSNNDTYDLSTTGGSWTYTIRDKDDTGNITTIAINSGIKDTVIVKVTAPSGGKAIYDTTTFKATSQGNPSVYDSAKVKTTAYSAYTSMSENFDGVSTPDLPFAWSKIVESSSSYAYVETSTTGSHSSPNNARMYNGSDLSATLLLITPALSTSAAKADKRLTFWAKSSYGDQNLIVGSMTDPNDAGTFTADTTIAINGTYTKYKVPYTGAKGTDYKAFKHGCDGTYDYYNIDNVVWQDMPAGPVYSISPDSAGFGTEYMGDTTAAQTFTITNLGIGTLTINSTSLTGGSADQFVLADTNTYPKALAEDQSLAVDVSFAPTTSGDKSAYLTVVDDQAKATHNTPLTGTGQDPNFGGGGTGSGGYYFANSLATGAPSHPSYSWIDTTGHTLVPIDPSMTDNKDGYLSDDDYEGPFPIGFSFPFFSGAKGGTFTEFYIQSNGCISFSDAEILPSNDPIPVDGDETDFIAWCWDDMDADDPDVTDTEVRYKSGTDKCVITFWHYPEYGASAGEYITAQVILYPGGNVKIQYNDAESDIPGTADFPDDCTIGIEGDKGTPAAAYGLQYRYNGSGGPMFGSDLALMFGNDDSSLPVELTSFIARAGNGKATLQWVTQSEINNAGFEVYRSTKKVGTYQMVATYASNKNLQGAGNSNNPKTYTYVDQNLVNGTSYWYKITDVDYNGHRSYHGPVGVVPNKNGLNLINDGNIPKSFALYANFPNPFNPNTTISFDIPAQQDGSIMVTVTVYNMLGQKVKSLVNGKMSPGSYQLEWDGTNDTGNKIASGIYIYGIRTDKFTSFKKMILMK